MAFKYLPIVIDRLLHYMVTVLTKKRFQKNGKARAQ